MENKQQHYLIKRNPDFTREGVIVKRNKLKQVYSETIVTNQKKMPLSKKLNRGDMIYVAETGYGIYAKGNIVELNDVLTFRTINEILEYYEKSKRKDAAYWIEKMKKLHEKKRESSNYVCRYHEYFVEQKLLRKTIPLEINIKRLSKPGISGSFLKLTNDEVKQINNPIFDNVTNLKSDIPGYLRMEIYNLFNEKLHIEHWIDIDHFVPKSIDGPGNIKENLVPIGLSLNRYKSNSIPSGLFKIALNYEDLKNLVPNDISINGLSYFRDKKHQDIANKITKVVNNWEIEKARKFYSDVLKVHHREYWEIIIGSNNKK